ncbi:MAG: hypothetical protein J6X88_10740 [Bacteroidales bacterium]|nr:hypothetical protein [Bacteroidales bacterium]
MKTILQTRSRRTAKLALLLALICAAVPTLQAQEYYKEAENIVSDGSIIREYKEDTRIVYSSNIDFNGFLLVTETGLTAPVLEIREDSYVNDFEIYNDTLYFCGWSYDALIQNFVGFAGYINLVTFPATAIRAYYLPEFKRLNKLEILHSSFGGPKHIVMTGKTAYDEPTIVDAIVTSPAAWNFYYTTDDDNNDVYDDVAATATYVVVAAKNTSDQTGDIYYFYHPMPGYSFLYGISTRVSMDSNICSNIILEAKEEDAFSSVCNILSGEFGLVVDVINYTGMNTPHPHVIIDVYNRIPCDLKYNPDEQKLDVLTNTSYYGGVMSEIFHVNTSNYVDGHEYNGHGIRSLDYLHTDPYHFIASGYYNKDNHLYIYKYLPSRVMMCSDVAKPRHWTIETEGMLDVNELEINHFEGTMSRVLQRSDEVPIKVRCYFDPRQNNQ